MMRICFLHLLLQDVPTLHFQSFYVASYQLEPIPDHPGQASCPSFKTLVCFAATSTRTALFLNRSSHNNLNFSLPSPFLKSSIPRLLLAPTTLSLTSIVMALPSRRPMP